VKINNTKCSLYAISKRDKQVETFVKNSFRFTMSKAYFKNIHSRRRTRSSIREFCHFRYTNLLYLFGKARTRCSSNGTRSLIDKLQRISTNCFRQSACVSSSLANRKNDCFVQCVIWYTRSIYYCKTNEIRVRVNRLIEFI